MHLMIFVTSRAFIRKAARKCYILYSPVSKCLLPFPSTKNRKEEANKGDASYLDISSTHQNLVIPRLALTVLSCWSHPTQHSQDAKHFAKPTPSLPEMLSPQLWWDCVLENIKRPMALTFLKWCIWNFRWKPRTNTPAFSSLLLLY